MEYNARAESGGRQLDFTAQPRLDWEPAGLADRNRVQMTYVPASRDGVRQVDAFLGGRLRRASRWSDELRDHMNHAAEDMVESFGPSRSCRPSN